MLRIEKGIFKGKKGLGVVEVHDVGISEGSLGFGFAATREDGW